MQKIEFECKNHYDEYPGPDWTRRIYRGSTYYINKREVSKIIYGLIFDTLFRYN